MEPIVISELNAATEHQLASAFGNVGQDMVPEVALDAEGVDLSRIGRISIVQLATREQCFILDVLDKRPEDPLVLWLREILQSDAVVKIIHDCRMDSDALWNLLRIKLANVHDTQSYHTAFSSQPDVNLNDTLQSYGLRPNDARDKGVYDRNHAFWAERPMTATMIEWAAGDLGSLFALRERQLDSCSDRAVESAKQLEAESLAFARSATVSTFRISANIGLFIGKGGSNIRALQRQTGTLIYGKGRRGDNLFMVFYANDRDLARVLQRAGTRRVEETVEPLGR